MRRLRKRRSYRTTSCASSGAVANSLEPRWLLAAVSWDGGGDGRSWFDGRNWSGDQPPTSGDDVVIDAPASPEVAIESGAAAVRSLVSNDPLSLADTASLQIGISATFHDAFRVAGRVVGGVLGTAGAGHFVAAGGVLQDVTFADDERLVGVWRAAGRLTVNGTLTLARPDAIGNGSVFFLGDDGNFIGGTGTVLLDDSSIFLDAGPAAADRSLTIEPGVEVRGTSGNIYSPNDFGHILNRGTIRVTGPGPGPFEVGGQLESSGYHRPFVNEGQIVAEPGSLLQISGIWTNTGTIRATAATVRLGGQFTSADLAGFSRVGGTVSVEGGLSVAQSPLNLTAQTGSLVLARGGIGGPGAVNAQDGARLIGRNGSLQDVTLNAPLDIDPDGTVRVYGTLDLRARVTGGALGDPAPTNPLGVVRVGPGASLSGVRMTAEVRLEDDGISLPIDNGLTIVKGGIRLIGNDVKLVAVGSQRWSFGTVTFESAGGASIVVRDGAAPDGSHAPAILFLKTTVAGGRGTIGKDPANVYPAAVVNEGTIVGNIPGAELVVDTDAFNDPSTGIVEASGGGIVRVNAPLTNFEPATSTLRGGTWNVGAGSAILLPPSVAVADNAAAVSLAGAGPDAARFPAMAGVVVNDGTLALAGGYGLTASGANGSFTNNGVLSLDAGSTLTVPGDFRQSGSGTLKVAVGGAPADGNAGMVAVGGAASLAGAIQPFPEPASYRPALTDAFAVLRAGAIAGKFDRIVQIVPPGTRPWFVRYGPADVTVAAGPMAPPPPDLATESDSGLSSSDNITSDTTPTLNGTAPEASLVHILANGAVVADVVPSAGFYAVTLPPLADGNYTIAARSVDAEGDEAEVSDVVAPLSVTIDTHAPDSAQVIYRPATSAGGSAAVVFRFPERVTNVEAADLEIRDAATGEIQANAIFTASADAASASAIFVLRPGALSAGGDYVATLRQGGVADYAGNVQGDPISGTFSASARPAVAGRYTAYYRPASGGDIDHTGAPAVPELNVIADDKRALMPGETGGFANVTSYNRGITSVVVDLSGYGNTSLGDFVFEMGSPARGWTATPTPTIVFQRYLGTGGSDRYLFRWKDGAITNTWLRVTVLATSRTGLTAPDVFYFGNLVGDTGGPGTPTVNVTDLASARGAIGKTDVAALARFDINRDGVINAADLAVVRSAQHRSLPPLIAPDVQLASAAALAVAPASVRHVRRDAHPPRREVLVATEMRVP